MLVFTMIALPGPRRHHVLNLFSSVNYTHKHVSNYPFLDVFAVFSRDGPRNLQLFHSYGPIVKREDIHPLVEVEGTFE